MTHREKVDRLKVEMQSKGVMPTMSAPLEFRLLWALGFEVPPPHFLSFTTIVVVVSTYFVVIFGFFSVMWNLLWRDLTVPGVSDLILLASVGLAGGLLMAWMLRRQSAKLRLPRWEDYPADNKIGIEGENP